MAQGGGWEGTSTSGKGLDRIPGDDQSFLTLWYSALLPLCEALGTVGVDFMHEIKQVPL